MCVIQKGQQRVGVRLRQLDVDLIAARLQRLERELAEPAGVGRRLIERAGAAQPLKVEHHVLGGERAPVHRLLVVPGHAVADGEPVGDAVGYLPVPRQRAGVVGGVQIRVGQGIDAAVDGPIADAELLHHAGVGRAGVHAADRLVGVGDVGGAGNGQRATVTRRRHLAAGGRVGHHRLPRRRRALLADGPPAAGGQQHAGQDSGQYRSDTDCHQWHHLISGYALPPGNPAVGHPATGTDSGNLPRHRNLVNIPAGGAARGGTGRRRRGAARLMTVLLPRGSSCRPRTPGGTGSGAWAACRRVPRPADPSCATWREWSCSS